MNYRVITMLRRRIAYTLIALILFFLILSFEYTALLLYKTTQETKKSLLREIGATLSLSPKTNYIDKLINDEFEGYDSVSEENFIFSGVGLYKFEDTMLSNIKDVNHVVGIDEVITYFCLPNNVNNVKEYSGINPFTQNDSADANSYPVLYQDCLSVIGSLSIDNLDIFRREQNILLEGIFPDEMNPGVVVSKRFSENNNLAIGDSIELSSIENDKVNSMSKRINIVGIYESNLQFEVLDTNFLGSGVFSLSPYNYIYCDYLTACDVIQQEQTHNYLTIYIDSPEHIESVEKEIQMLSGYDFEKLQIENDTDFFYNYYGKELNDLTNNASSFIIVFMVISFGLYVFVLSFWHRESLNDMGILVVLGESKRRIILQKLIESLYIFIVAAFFAIIVGRFLSIFMIDLLQIDFISSDAPNMISSFYTGQEEFILELNVTTNWTSIVNIVVFGLALSFVSVIIPVISVCRYNAKQLFENKDK